MPNLTKEAKMLSERRYYFKEEASQLHFDLYPKFIVIRSTEITETWLMPHKQLKYRTIMSLTIITIAFLYIYI